MKNYIEEFMKDNDLKVGDKFNITKSKYCLNNPYHISKIDDSCKLYDDEEENSNDNLLLELITGKSQIEKIKHEKWVPKKGELYWFVGDDGNIVSCRNDKDHIDNYRFKNIRYFMTEEEAKRYLEITEYINSKKSHFTLEEWNNPRIGKWVIYYDNSLNEINYIECNENPGNETYFNYECDCIDIIDKFPKEDLLKYYFNIE